MSRKLPFVVTTTVAMTIACFSGNPSIKETGGVDTFDDSTAPAPDEDGDGFDTTVDCDDADAAVNPDAVEVCDNTLDDDCDGLADGEDEDCAEG